jgi:hypothetical protein
MKKLTITNKAEEIEVIRALAENPTYFADYFSGENDIKQMIMNIERDHPLLTDTEFVVQSQIIQDDLKRQIKEKDEFIEETLELLNKATKDLSQSENCLAETRELLHREKERAQWFLRDWLKFQNDNECGYPDPRKYFRASEILMAKLYTNIPLNHEELKMIESTLNPPQS